jgi:aspartate/tyrosine/aromatic aminotransferase
MYDLKKRADSDLSPSKVDLGVGIYRNEQGAYQELQCVKEVSHTEEVERHQSGTLANYMLLLIGKTSSSEDRSWSRCKTNSIILQ